MGVSPGLDPVGVVLSELAEGALSVLGVLVGYVVTVLVNLDALHLLPLPPHVLVFREFWGGVLCGVFHHGGGAEDEADASGDDGDDDAEGDGQGGPFVRVADTGMVGRCWY